MLPHRWVHLEPVHSLAARQFGVISRHQAEELGVSKRVWYRLVDNGLIVPIHRGVGVLFGYEATRRQKMMAATLWVGRDAIVSHRSAGELWGIWNADSDDPVDVIVPGRRGLPSLSGVVPHSPRDVDELAPVRHEGLRVTTPVRTLLDLAGVAPHAVSSVVERMLMSGLITRQRIKAAVARHSKQGRAGIGPLRELLATWPYADKPVESVLELRMQRVLGGYFPDFDTQIPVGSYRLDIGWPLWKVAVETDGWGKYESREDFSRLAERDADLQAHGWTVIHVTWRDVARRPGYVQRLVRQALESRGCRWAESGWSSSPIR
ncbi:MAG: DUF559 domain-containing protein [Actinobacteria bacterium]|nr:DUF559 domain-containing protein [Actinomycetota bacterium]